VAELEIKPTRRQRLRVFSILAIANILSLILMYLLVGGGRDFFARRTHLTAYMPDAAGITTDSEVRLSGIKIGKVDKIELSGILDPRRAVRAEMLVLTRYLKGIPDDSQTDVSADTLVGYQFIDIAEGKSPVPIKEEGVLESEPVKQAQDRADLMKSIHNDLTQVDQILADMQSPTSQLGSFITSEKEYDSVILRVRGFDENLHTFLNPQSDLGKAFYTDQFYNSFRNAVVELDKTLASIQSGEGAGRLLATSDQYDNYLQQLTSLRSALVDLNAGKGRLGSALVDDELWRQASRLLRQVDQTIAALNAGEGSAGRLLSNAQLYESLNGSLHDMETLLRDFREHPRRYLRVKPFQPPR
jgi:phospholipid/cholesterol/gamma-HCH transport system substrate-binding protein